ncbi:MAG TPA: hypothetical protein PK573_09885, partial [Spirochaetota bacterium]|nr:hypothetical protein [Spirochaetota bacterium]
IHPVLAAIVNHGPKNGFFYFQINLSSSSIHVLCMFYLNQREYSGVQILSPPSGGGPRPGA